MTVEAGAIGSVLEEALGEQGLTIGHYPQSLHSSTVGGWIAHRGVGTFSSLYGRIEDLLMGLEVVLANGSVLTTRAVPASAAGPDLKRLFLGAEGTLGIVTAATLQVHRRAPTSVPVAFVTPFLPRRALDLARREARAGRVSAGGGLRLYDPVETTDQFSSPWVCRPTPVSRLRRRRAEPLSRRRSWDPTIPRSADALTETDGAGVAEPLVRYRFSTAGLCRTLGTRLGVADALEVAADWAHIGEAYERMRTAMLAAAGEGARVYGHASHVYPSGTNIYMLFHATAPDEEQVPDRYRAVLTAAMDACLATGGTITHHHGVGLLKAPWMAQELGSAGLGVLSRIKHALDPDSLLNPGRLGL